MSNKQRWILAIFSPMVLALMIGIVHLTTKDSAKVSAPPAKVTTKPTIEKITHEPALELPEPTTHSIVKAVIHTEVTNQKDKNTNTKVTFENGETMEFFDVAPTPFRVGKLNHIVYLTHYSPETYEPVIYQIVSINVIGEELYLSKIRPKSVYI